MISEYLIKSNKDWILIEYREKNSLSEYGRQQLVLSLCAFMRQFFASDHISKEQKIMTITASLQIFPNLRSQNEKDGGVVCIYIHFSYLLAIIMIIVKHTSTFEGHSSGLHRQSIEV